MWFQTAALPTWPLSAARPAPSAGSRWPARCFSSASVAVGLPIDPDRLEGNEPVVSHLAAVLSACFPCSTWCCRRPKPAFTPACGGCGFWRLLPRACMKHVCNQDVFELSGEVYFYVWSTKRLGLNPGQTLRTIKDVTILSAVVGYLVMLAFPPLCLWLGTLGPRQGLTPRADAADRLRRPLVAVRDRGHRGRGPPGDLLSAGPPAARRSAACIWRDSCLTNAISWLSGPSSCPDSPGARGARCWRFRISSGGSPRYCRTIWFSPPPASSCRAAWACRRPPWPECCWPIRRSTS